MVTDVAVGEGVEITGGKAPIYMQVTILSFIRHTG